MQIIFQLLLSFTAIFIIFLVLIQKGRGGGLAGAFGGMGGQSAFGTKAGDVFTKITVVTAIIWFSLCIGIILILRKTETKAPDVESGRTNVNVSAPANPDGGAGTSTAPTPE